MPEIVYYRRRRFLGAGALMLAPPQLPIEGSLPSLRGATAWLNSPPLNSASLQGKVVLIDFWTYTCINWLRSLPYIRAWAEKYRDQGLAVIGVHTPEFTFEKNIDNVQRAALEMGVAYPVAVDNDYAIWRAFRNNSWPAIYIADSQGQLRHHHFGEGQYHRSERVIQHLLSVNSELVAVNGRGVEAAAEWSSLQSPENYLGSQRTENFASPGGALSRRRVYSSPPALQLNHWALAGEWTFSSEAVILHAAGGRIAYRFHARDLHIVLGPVAHGRSVRFRVLIDGLAPHDAHGVDVDGQGNGVVTEQRLYQLIRQQRPISHRLFEIEFLDSGVAAFSFSFG